MVEVRLHGKDIKELNLAPYAEKARRVAEQIEARSGDGNDFLGWMDFASRQSEEELQDIIDTAKMIREKYDALVVCGIGGSYLGARAVIEALKGFFPDDDFEIVYLGNTLSADYTYQLLRHLEGKRYAINVISKSGTTTETAISFRLLKEQLLREFGKDYVREAVFATTDAKGGTLRKEVNKEGYKSFVIPGDIGGRFSVITPVGLLPIACAGIDIKEFMRGVKDGEKDYSSYDYALNPAYYYGLLRYLLNVEKHYTSEMFVAYDLHYKMIEEWLKQLFDESEGKDNQGTLCSSGIFTTDLHSMGQFIQQGAPVLYETILRVVNTNFDLEIPEDKDNLDDLNYLKGKKLSDINHVAYQATLKAHTEGHTPAIVVRVDKMNPYHLGNLMYFFFRACAFSAYMLEVNPFNQPGVEVYKVNMFKLLGKPGYEDK